MKKLKLTSILFLCLSSVFAQFNGEGYYRIQNKLISTEYIAFEIPAGSGVSMSKSLDASTIVLIKENESNPGKYTIFNYDRTSYLDAKGRPSSRSFPAEDGRSIDDSVAVFDIQTSKVKGSYVIAFNKPESSKLTYLTLRKFPEKPNDLTTTGSKHTPPNESKGPVWNFIEVSKKEVKAAKKSMR